MPAIHNNSTNIAPNFSSLARFFLFFGAINGFLSVGLAALGKHLLRSRVDTHAFEVFQTAAQYQVHHALVLIFVALLLHHFKDSLTLRLAGWFFLVGVTLFSGSLYLVAVTGIRVIGIVTPVGGVLLMLGWGFLAWFALRRPTE